MQKADLKVTIPMRQVGTTDLKAEIQDYCFSTFKFQTF